jgi:hypothetical protein
VKVNEAGHELVPHVAALANIEALASLNAAEIVETLNLTCQFLLRAGSDLLALDLATQAVSASTMPAAGSAPL